MKEKRYTVKQIYKKEKKLNQMKEFDNKDALLSKAKDILQLYTITALSYPLMGLGVLYDAPLWLTLSPLALNAIPYAMGIKLLFLRKKVYDLENELSNIHNNMSIEKTNELAEYAKKKIKTKAEKNTVSQ